MSRQPSSSPAPSLKKIPDTNTQVRLRPVEVLLFAILPLEVLGVRGVPANEIAATAIVIAALFRAPILGRTAKWWIPALTLFWSWCLLSSLLTPADLNTRRLLHLGVWVLLTMVIASGRVNFASMVSGLGLGLLVGSISGALRIGGGSGYEGRLTGLFGDPNVAGVVLVVYGLLFASLLPGGRPFSLARNRWQVAVIGVSAVALVLTLSRTSLLALGIGLVWLVLAARVHWLVTLGLFSFLVPVVFNWTETLKNWGPFAERGGSDALRDRILESELAMVAQQPILGNGAGTAKVKLEAGNFFFHNSYIALQSEFGMVGLAIYVVIASVILWMLVRLPRQQRNLPLEMGLIGLGVCALNLGEVLLHLPAAVLFGAAIRWAAVARTVSAVGEPVRVPVRKGSHGRIHR
jgi:O-antigen ligase